MFVDLGIQDGMCMRHNVICGLPGSTVYLTENTMCLRLKTKQLIP